MHQTFFYSKFRYKAKRIQDRTDSFCKKHAFHHTADYNHDSTHFIQVIGFLDDPPVFQGNFPPEADEYHIRQCDQSDPADLYQAQDNRFSNGAPLDCHNNCGKSCHTYAGRRCKNSIREGNSLPGCTAERHPQNKSTYKNHPRKAEGNYL